MTEGDRFFKQVRRLELVSTKLVESLLAGNYRSVFRGTGIEFDEVRDYVLGDDVRRIDWNVTSRMGNPYTKTYREEREINLFLMVDMSASLYTGSGVEPKNRVALLVFAILAMSAIANNDKVGGIFFSDRIERWVPPRKGKKHVLRLVNDLLTLKPAGRGSDLKLALRTVSESLKRRGICVIISDFKTEGYWPELGHCARKHDVIAVKLFDKADFVFPESGVMELEDPETGDVMISEGLFKSFRSRYNEFWEKHHQKWKRECHRRGVETLTIGTSDDAGLKLVQFFKKRRRH
jgi:uncharacterized protein (DUF58 family)